ncbi:alpha/beta fold hydrolase [Pseudomonas sp. 1912-s]|uniref:alpha/beta hydrolase n=1 Tax=Pseudomonas sp. 1912-s TaxID=3033802 RepID=UPI0023DE6FE0|nr:alpha/beta fold hydrolase [Pseudomonas sp. 1912-s]MDF3202500.1 alpha/beta fold hydrolase [Pseudomonas sp. 1912-s]
MRSLGTLLLSCIAGCAELPVSPVSPAPENFADYRQKTLLLLERNRRFQSADHALELAWNAPREWQPEHPNGKGILLVHGLGDSPGSFIDIAPQLAGQGYRVRTLLLPGHGTQPADMLGVDITDWQHTVARQVALLRQDADEVYLGGFSTGANLVLEYAMDDPAIAGLLLFSPAFKARLPFDWLLPWLSKVKPWLRQPDGPAPQQTALRYQNVPTNGFAQFYFTSTVVRSRLAMQTYDRPVLIVSAAHDSVVDVGFVRETFSQRFPNPASRMIWYGDLVPGQRHPRMLVRSDRFPAEHISQFSHMSVLFSPDNPQYGRQGKQPMCSNGQNAEGYRQCLAGAAVWYSDWGYREAGKVHARLTYNPYFEWQAQVMAQVLEAAQSQENTH